MNDSRERYVLTSNIGIDVDNCTCLLTRLQGILVYTRRGE